MKLSGFDCPTNPSGNAGKGICTSRYSRVAARHAVAFAKVGATRSPELLISQASRRPQGGGYRLRANRVRAARARRCARQETAIEPSTGSTPEYRRIEAPGRVRLPTAHEQHDRSCPRRAWSQRSCARRDSHPCGCAGAIAVKHSAQAPRETLRKRIPRNRRVCDYLNAQTGSLRSELATAPSVAQEISGRLQKSQKLVSLEGILSRERRFHPSVKFSAIDGECLRSLIGRFCLCGRALLKRDTMIRSRSVRVC